jgi:hypothetical protein
MRRVLVADSSGGSVAAHSAVPRFRSSILCLWLACACKPEPEPDPSTQEPSPNASILPSPLASQRPLPLTDASPASHADAFDAGDSDAAEPPTPVYFDTEKALDLDTLPLSEAPGALFEGHFAWEPRSAGGRGDPRGRFPVRIEFSALGRMRMVIESERMPLPEGSELRARFDRYGHVFVWPELTGYRVLAPGTLRAIFEELRADVSPLQEASTESTPGGKVLGLPVRQDTVKTSMGTLVMEQAQIGGLNGAGLLLCRLLSELVLAKPDNNACRGDWTPLKAEFGWAEADRFGFLVSAIERKQDLRTKGLSSPPEEVPFRRRELPPPPPVPWMTEPELARLEPGPKNKAGVEPRGTPARDLVIANAYESPRYVMLNGEFVAWLGPGAQVHLSGLRPGAYNLVSRDFLGLEPELRANPNVPGRQQLGQRPSSTENP